MMTRSCDARQCRRRALTRGCDARYDDRILPPLRHYDSRLWRTAMTHNYDARMWRADITALSRVWHVFYRVYVIMTRDIHARYPRVSFILLASFTAFTPYRRAAMTCHHDARLWLLVVTRYSRRVIARLTRCCDERLLPRLRHYDSRLWRAAMTHDYDSWLWRGIRTRVWRPIRTRVTSMTRCCDKRLVPRLRHYDVPPSRMFGLWRVPVTRNVYAIRTRGINARYRVDELWRGYDARLWRTIKKRCSDSPPIPHLPFPLFYTAPSPYPSLLPFRQRLEIGRWFQLYRGRTIQRK